MWIISFCWFTNCWIRMNIRWLCVGFFKKRIICALVMNLRPFSVQRILCFLTIPFSYWFLWCDICIMRSLLTVQIITNTIWYLYIDFKNWIKWIWKSNYILSSILHLENSKCNQLDNHFPPCSYYLILYCSFHNTSSYLSSCL